MATISAIHCPRPLMIFSFFASTITTMGALINNGSGEWLIIKSQSSLRDFSLSILNSIPENKLIGWLKVSLIYINILVIISSDRAFSVLMALVNGTFSFSMALRISLTSCSGIWVNIPSCSNTLISSACLTRFKLKSRYAMVCFR